MFKKTIIAALLAVIASAVTSAQVEEMTVGRFPKQGFFLHFPFAEDAWKAAPNVLDSLAHADFPVTYLPQDAEEIYFSGIKENGRRGIYVTYHLDSVWTRPVAVLEDALAGADCLFPMLSPDRLNLYFSASGLEGNGGYDLYVTRRESMDGWWGAPVNMGQPFSSEGNDYLFALSDDGRYAAFASDRENAVDSIDVCVIDYEATVSQDGGIPENEETRNYMEKMDQVRSYRDSINFHNRQLDTIRADYASATDASERTRMYEEIQEKEKLVPELQQKLEQAIAQLQEIEMDFLFKGVVLDPEKLAQKDEKEQSEGFMFPDWEISEFPSDFVIQQF